MIQKAVEHLKSVDSVLEELTEKIGPVCVKARRVAVFQSLVQAIIYQQLNSKAADTMLSRFKALFGDGYFPSAEEVLVMHPEQLRSAGLSRPKANYIRGIAEKGFIREVPVWSDEGYRV